MSEQIYAQAAKMIDHSLLQPTLTDADLERKLRDLVAYSGSRADCERLIAAIRTLDDNPDAGSVMALAAS